MNFILYTVDSEGNTYAYLPTWFPKDLQRLATHNLTDYKLRRIKKRRNGLRKAK